jgi:hypothetical protein
MGFSEESQNVFDKETLDPVNEFHKWDGPNGDHGKYNRATKEIVDDFIDSSGIDPSDFTRIDAEEVIDVIKHSDDIRIKGFIGRIGKATTKIPLVGFIIGCLTDPLNAVESSGEIDSSEDAWLIRWHNQSNNDAADWDDGFERSSW